MKWRRPTKENPIRNHGDVAGAEEEEDEDFSDVSVVVSDELPDVSVVVSDDLPDVSAVS